MRKLMAAYTWNAASLLCQLPSRLLAGPRRERVYNCHGKAGAAWMQQLPAHTHAAEPPFATYRRLEFTGKIRNGKGDVTPAASALMCEVLAVSTSALPTARQNSPLTRFNFLPGVPCP